MRSLVVELHIPAEEYLALYQGLVKDVVAYDQFGRVIKFPANILQSYVSYEGVHGRFCIYYDDNNKFHHISRCEV